MTNRTHTAGSVRDARTGKGRHDLISPVVEQKLAKHMETGAAHYGDRNWESGQPLSWYIDSAIRHLAQFREGLRDDNHDVAGLWNLHGLVHTVEMIRRGLLPAELDDLPNYTACTPSSEDIAEAIRVWRSRAAKGAASVVQQQPQATESRTDGVPQVPCSGCRTTPVRQDGAGGIAGEGEGWSIRGHSPLH